MMRYLALSLGGIYMLSGCGGGGGNASGSSSTTQDNMQAPYTNYYNNGPAEITMKHNKSYTVYPGDRIEKSSEEAKVTIVHIDGHKESTVTLVSGDAILIRK